MGEDEARRSRRFRLGDFELDLETGELWRDGAVVELPPQPTRLLLLLARRPGRLVTREQIREEIWGDTVVEFDTAINSAVRAVRAALGDDASDPRYIETVPRRGYRFVAEPASAVDREEEAAREGASSRGAPSWLWPAGVALVLSLALLLLPRMLPGPTPLRVTVVPARASVADSPADTLSGPLTRALEEGIRTLDPRRVRLVEWAGPVAYDRARRALVRDGEDLEVDLAVEVDLGVQGDTLRAGVSLSDVGLGAQLWHRTFEHPLEDPGGAVERIRERVEEELRARAREESSEVSPQSSVSRRVTFVPRDA